MERKSNGLRARRLARGWTQVELAELADIDQANISRLELGVLLPGTVTIDKLAAAFGVEPWTVYRWLRQGG